MQDIDYWCGPQDEARLLRTLCIRNIPAGLSDEEIKTHIYRNLMAKDIFLGEMSDGRFCLFQVQNTAVASEIMKIPTRRIGNYSMNIEAALRTINSYVPHNVTFGKPLSIGQHVMAANPVKFSSAALSQRSRIMFKVDRIAFKIIDSLGSKYRVPKFFNLNKCCLGFRLRNRYLPKMNWHYTQRFSNPYRRL